MFNSVEAFQQFSKNQMEAATASATALTNGVQQLFAETTELSKKSVETGTEAFQSLLASKSMDRALQVQMDFAKSAYENMVSGSTKLGGIVSSTAQEMVRPLEGIVQRVQDAAKSSIAA